MPLKHQYVTLIQVTDNNSTSENGVRQGSGYLVTDELVLTARHVVYGQNASAEASLPDIEINFLIDNPSTYKASVIWQNERVDICLLKLNFPYKQPNLSWGKVLRANRTRVECEGCGFPRATIEVKKDESKFSSAGFKGVVDLDAYVSDNLLAIGLEPGYATAKAILWKGVSGAAVFAGDYLIGVIVSTLESYEGERLTACPIEKILNKADDNAIFSQLLGITVENLVEVNPKLDPFEPTNIVKDGLLELAEKHLATMPTDEIAPVGTLPKSSRMLLRHNANFVGRDDALKAIAKALKSGETTNIGQASTVTGIGGVGKTQLACEFVHRYGQYFQGGVFWLNFAEASGIESEIAQCGTQAHLKLFGKDEQNLEVQVSLVQAAWCEAMPRLLIFDNCEDPKLLTKWQPTTGGCRVLVTSRRAQWQKGVVKTLPLGLLSDIESLELLLKYRPDLVEDTNSFCQKKGKKGCQRTEKKEVKQQRDCV
jgi:hypothetical protein